MKCISCGNVINKNMKVCPVCGGTTYDDSIDFRKVPFFLQMWFIITVFIVTIFCFGFPAIILLFIRLIKYPNKRKGALIGVAGSIVAFFLLCFVVYFFDTADDRKVEKYIKNGQYNEAIEFIESNYDITLYEYYYWLASVYEKQGDYDTAASVILNYVDIVADITQINNEAVDRLRSYKGKVLVERESDIEKRLNDIADAKKKLADEQAAKEAAEKKAAEEQVAKEAAEKKAAEEQAAKEAAEKQAAEEQAAKEATEKKAAQEQAAVKGIVDNAEELGRDIILDSQQSSMYEDKYYKLSGLIEEIEDNAYMIRYLSNIKNNKNIYYVWIQGKDTSNLSVGDGVRVVGEYVGFAKESVAPTLKEYILERVSDPFESILVSTAKRVNDDIGFDDLLRYDKYQEYVYVEGEVYNVFDSCVNMEDIFGNQYVIYDNRLNSKTIVPGDYINVYGTFEGVEKDGYVWPLISWLY